MFKTGGSGCTLEDTKTLNERSIPWTQLSSRLTDKADYNDELAKRTVNIMHKCSRVISLILITHLVILSSCDGEFCMFSYRYSRLHLEPTSATREPGKTLSLLLSPSAVSNKRTKRAFMTCRVPYDVSGICSFQLNKLSGDVHPNPGPSQAGIKFPCGECRNNQDAILCARCDQWFHARCIGMGRQVFKYYLDNHHLDWECDFCSLPNFSDSFFDQTGNESFTVEDSIHNELSTNVEHSVEAPPNKVNPRENAENYLQQAALHLNSSPRDLKIAHLNICSIRNKIDELRVLQSICGFDIIAITETHLDRSISNDLLHIDGMKLFRRDNKMQGRRMYFILCRISADDHSKRLGLQGS